MHYTVAVVTNENDEDEVDLLLAPYDENIINALDKVEDIW